MIEREAGIEYRRHIGSFFQANRFVRREMLEKTGALASGAGETFMDICCGVGFFSLRLASQGMSGAGFDIDTRSIRFARENARSNGITGVTFSALASSGIGLGGARPDVIIVDPPRAGMDKKTRWTLSRLQAPFIIYISCNPSTFARDARDLLKAGYSVNDMILMDMFPGTFHVEVMALFHR